MHKQPTAVKLTKTTYIYKNTHTHTHTHTHAHTHTNAHTHMHTHTYKEDDTLLELRINSMTGRTALTRSYWFVSKVWNISLEMDKPVLVVLPVWQQVEMAAHLDTVAFRRDHSSYCSVAWSIAWWFALLLVVSHVSSAYCRMVILYIELLK